MPSGIAQPDSSTTASSVEIVGAGDEPGVDDAEQAFADDQAGRHQHAQALGEAGVRLARSAQRL